MNRSLKSGYSRQLWACLAKKMLFPGLAGSEQEPQGKRASPVRKVSEQATGL